MAIKSLVEAVVLALTGLVVALAVSWLLLAQFSFSYGFWHDHAGIGEAIDRFAPHNRYRHGFQLTTRDQRVELFTRINRAIHRGGQGLADLTYKVPGHPQQSLLRDPEIVHLTDVANLISAARAIVLVVTVIWLGLWAYYWQMRKAPPSLRNQLLGTLFFTALIAGVVLLVGPVKVFYTLHIWLFPKDHQWFFLLRRIPYVHHDAGAGSVWLDCGGMGAPGFGFFCHPAGGASESGALSATSW